MISGKESFRMFFMWIFMGVCGRAFESLLIFQQINVNRIVTLTGSDSINIIQSVHLFVWDEAQRQGVTLYSIVIMELGYLKKHYISATFPHRQVRHLLFSGRLIVSRDKGKCAIVSRLHSEGPPACEKKRLTTQASQCVNWLQQKHKSTKEGIEKVSTFSVKNSVYQYVWFEDYSILNFSWLIFILI